MDGKTTRTAPAIDDDELKRRWASRQLRAPRGAAKELVAAAFARSLREATFQPPRELHEAFWLLAGSDLHRRPMTPAPQAELYHLLHREVENFARQFFDFDPVRRRKRWIALSERAAGDPRLSLCLAKFKAGLEVVSTDAEQAPPGGGPLMEELMRLFVLPPRDGAVLRQALRDRATRSPAETEVAAEWCRKQGIAAITPDLLDELATWQGRPRRIKKLAKRRAALHQETQKASAASKKSSALTALFMVLFILLSFVVKEIYLDREINPRRPARMPPMSFERPGSFGDAEEANQHMRDFRRRMEEDELRSMNRLPDLPSQRIPKPPHGTSPPESLEDRMRALHAKFGSQDPRPSSPGENPSEQRVPGPRKSFRVAPGSELHGPFPFKGPPPAPGTEQNK